MSSGGHTFQVAQSILETKRLEVFSVGKKVDLQLKCVCVCVRILILILLQCPWLGTDGQEDQGQKWQEERGSRIAAVSLTSMTQSFVALLRSPIVTQ